MINKIVINILFFNFIYAGHELIDLSNQRLLEIQSQLSQIYTQLGYCLKSGKDYEPLTIHERMKWIDQYFLIKKEFQMFKDRNYPNKNHYLIENLDADFYNKKKRMKKAKNRIKRALNQLNEERV